MTILFNASKSIAIFFLLGLLIGCGQPYKGFYQQLGYLECQCATTLEISIRHLQSPDRDTVLDEIYKLQFEEALSQFDSFKNVHWYDAEEIQSIYTEEERMEQYMEGYKACNCDTCLFKNDTDKIENKKSKIKAI